MDARGQVSIELVFLTGFIMVLVMGITSYLGEDVELNQAMAAARSGAIEGANVNSFAIYPEDAFDKYNKERPWFLNPANVKIIKVEYENRGFNATYNKTWIQLRITASCPTLKNHDKNPLGDRINYYTRKRISESFGTSDQTNIVYNPSFSNRYVFTTRDVKWI